MLILALLLIPFAAHSACQAPEPLYRVKPNGTSTTRPAYTLTDGVLGKKIVARAPVGATCDTQYKPTKPSHKDLYASYDSTGTVALCSKR